MSLSTLNTVLSSIEENFDYVNYGGCACVAAMIAEQVRTVYPVMRITSCGSDLYHHPNLDEIRSLVSNPLDKYLWLDNGLRFDHVWVEICVDDQWYALDSTGVKPVGEMYDDWERPAAGSFTLEEIESLAYQPGWNDTFNRDQLPAIEQVIQTLGELL